MASGAQAAVNTLKAHGIRHIFGIPGVQNLEYFDAFESEGMPVILVSHELAASFMADAVGRVTGTPGVAVVVPGPGLTNIFTGMGEALLDSAPMLALLPGVRSNYREKFQLHEINHEAAAQNLAKEYIRVATVDEIAGAVARAVMRSMSGEPGPVVVEAPYNVLLENTSSAPAAVIPLDTPKPSDAEIDRAVEMLLSAKKPGIHAGFGASGASAECIELAELLDAPVSTTISGRGVIPENHELSVGFGFGPAGTHLAEDIFKDRDLVLAVGCKFSEVGSGAYNLKMPKLIHIDASTGVLNVNFKADIAIASDAKVALKAIVDRVRARVGNRPRSDLRKRIAAAHRKRIEKFEALKPSKDSVSPAKFLFELRKRAPRDSIMTTDSGGHTFHAVFSYDAYVPRSILSPVDFSSMGYGIPAAIGASVAAPTKKVIALVGDGGMMMTGSEMATAKRLGLPLLIVLFNDGALGLIRQAQKRGYGRETAVDIRGIDFEKYAGAFGFDYEVVANDNETSAKLDRVMTSTKPTLLDVRVKYDELTRHTMGTAISVMKRTPPSVILRIAARTAWRMIFG